ncbi:MAG: exodeoxyribonuclease VII small subunit [Solobacterium sp.]|nr:exodeoxyribonuclease VII small subunit [Solobacterium sp.]
MTKPKTFEASMDRLDEIVTLLEENEQPLDETIGLFEEGLKLIKSCDDQLKVFEQKVEELSKANGETK